MCPTSVAISKTGFCLQARLLALCLLSSLTIYMSVILYMTTHSVSCIHFSWDWIHKYRMKSRNHWRKKSTDNLNIGTEHWKENVYIFGKCYVFVAFNRGTLSLLLLLFSKKLTLNVLFAYFCFAWRKWSYKDIMYVRYECMCVYS